MGSPIRISTALHVLTAHRRISLFAASFFAGVCLGIPHTPFLALPSRFACLNFFSFTLAVNLSYFRLFVLDLIFSLMSNLFFIVFAIFLLLSSFQCPLECHGHSKPNKKAQLSLPRKEVIHPHVPVDTLLRLHPNHQSHLRQLLPCG